MSDAILRRANQFLADRMGDLNAVTVTYKRDNQSVVIDRARVGASAHQGDTATGGIIEWAAVDFLIDAKDLSFDGGATLFQPRRGDEIETTHRGRPQTFLVTNQVGDDNYTNSDEYEITLRIHTELITPLV